jgi:hypothetical protein
MTGEHAIAAAIRDVDGQLRRRALDPARGLGGDVPLVDQEQVLAGVASLLESVAALAGTLSDRMTTPDARGTFRRTSGQLGTVVTDLVRAAHQSSEGRP